MTPDLLKAILAMDAYNRQGGDVVLRGLVVEGTQVGSAHVGTFGADNRITVTLYPLHRLPDATTMPPWRVSAASSSRNYGDTLPIAPIV
jgi:hypothetical protein